MFPDITFNPKNINVNIRFKVLRFIIFHIPGDYTFVGCIEYFGAAAEGPVLVHAATQQEPAAAKSSGGGFAERILER